jgi:tetratricopeptide (TPR) repeat protein
MSLVRNKPTITKKIILIFLGIISCLLLLELGLRLGGFVFTSFQEYSNRTSFSKKGSYRIMCLGESTTAGQYPHFLEEILNQSNTDIKFSVIDRGVVGINSIDILSRLEDNLNIYRPDMVITMMGNNDGFVTYYKDIPEADTGIFRHCRLYRLIRLIYMHIAGKLKHEGIYGLDKTGSKISVALKERGTTVRKGSFPNEESLKKAIALNLKNDWACVELGKICQQQGRFLEAEGFLKQAIAFNPNNDRAYVVLREFYRQQGRFPEAEELLKQAIAINPKNDWACVELGEFYQQQGRFPKAEGLFKQAIAFNPKNDWACVGLGENYRLQGRSIEAEELFKQAIAFNPKNDWRKERGYGVLASLYRQMNKAGLVEEYNKKLINTSKHTTVDNYQRVKVILDKRGIRLVCVQYPMRSVKPLKKIFEGQQGVIFVDNEKVFKYAVSRQGYKEYFRDLFGGDFGHCTDKGNKLLAKNIANAILKEVFGR